MPPRSGGGGGCFFVAIGGIMAFCLFFAWLFASTSYGAAIAISLFFAGSIWLLVFGIAKSREKKLPPAVHAGILVGITLVFSALGPTVSRSMQVSEEKRLYAELSKDTAKASDWVDRYQAQVPEEFRRKGWRLEWMKARVREAKRDKKAADLRTVTNECDAAEDSDDLEPAREDAAAALKELYHNGKKKMFAPAQGGTEFPVDPALREAFGLVLDELSKSKDPNLYVLFKNSADLTDPPGIDKALTEWRADPEVKGAYPKGNAPVIEKGAAFDAKYDVRRRTTFISAMSESFALVFDGDLLKLVPLEPSEKREKKIVLEVSSRMYRVPDFFSYERTDSGGKKRIAGLLFAVNVEWDFELFSGSGKSLFKAPKKTSRPTDARFTTNPGDPDWAPYSVMMDSAYFNYSREVTGSFGLTPPAPKDVFAYTP